MDEEEMKMECEVTGVAHELRSPRFLHGMHNLFDKFCVVGIDGTQKLSSNGFLNMAFTANITPNLVDSLAVLQFVDMSITSDDASGLLFEDFVNCASRLSLVCFPGLDTARTAELFMLQLDQATMCLSQKGQILSSLRSKRNGAGLKDPKVNGNKKKSGDHPKSKFDEPGHTEQGNSKQKAPHKQRPHQVMYDTIESKDDTLYDRSAEEKRERTFETCSKDEKEEEEKSSSEYSRGSYSRRLLSVASSSPLPFLERVQADLEYRQEKLNRMMDREMEKIKGHEATNRKTLLVNASRQKASSQRLYSSRQDFFEKNVERFSDLLYCDPVTGQPFFQPQLVASSTKRSRAKSVPTINIKNGPEERARTMSVPEPRQNVNENRAAAAAAASAEEVEDIRTNSRFHLLYEKAMQTQSNKLGIVKEADGNAIQAANSKKLAPQTEKYFVTKLRRDLSAVFDALPEGDISVETMLETFNSLTGALEKSRANAKARALSKTLVNYLCNQGEKNVVTRASLRRFIELVTAAPKGATFLSLSRHEQNTIRHFLQLYNAQKSYSESQRSKAESVKYTFKPFICPRSRKLDVERRRKSTLDSSRQVELYLTAEQRNKKLEEKLAQAKEAELDECTFHPKISKEYVGPGVASEYAQKEISRFSALLQRSSPRLPKEQGVFWDDHDRPRVPKSAHINSSKSAEIPIGCVKSFMKPTEQSKRRASNGTPQAMLSTRKPGGDQVDTIESSMPPPPPPPTYLRAPIEKKFGKRQLREEEQQEEEEEKGSSVCSESTDRSVGIDDWLLRYADTKSKGYEEEERSTELLMYVDVQLKHGVERIDVYKNDNVDKIAARFSAIHELNAAMEEQLQKHLHHLVEHHGEDEPLCCT